MSIFIKSGLIVTGDDAGTRHDPGAILIAGDRIVWVGPMNEAPEAARYPEVEVIDASRAIVMPGLVNAHMHSNECFEQGAYDNLPLELWLMQSYPPFGMPQLSEREHYLRTMICAMESIRSGVTTVQDDLLHIAITPEAVDGAAKAYSDAGLRAVITVAMWDRPFLDCMPYLRDIVPADLAAELDALPLATAEEQVALFERHHRAWQGHRGLLKIIPAPSGPQRCSNDLLRAAAELSARYELPVAPGRCGNAYAALHHESRDLADRARYRAARRAAVFDYAQSPVQHEARQRRLPGPPASDSRRQCGARYGWDSDQRHGRPDRSLPRREPAAQWISAEEAFRMATLGGARSTGLEDHVGSLEAGKKADVILLDRDTWGFIPLNDPIRQLAFSVTSECVRTSIIDGRIVMRDRSIALLDEAVLKAEVSEAAERFRREHLPKMQAGAKRVEPYVRQVYARATGVDLDLAQPLRMPPRQS
jgi:5-methylthioadenosine/S-adenosylhomocysteine deaminase